MPGRGSWRHERGIAAFGNVERQSCRAPRGIGKHRTKGVEAAVASSEFLKRSGARSAVRLLTCQSRLRVLRAFGFAGLDSLCGARQQTVAQATLDLLFAKEGSWLKQRDGLLLVTAIRGRDMVAAETGARLADRARNVQRGSCSIARGQLGQRSCLMKREIRMPSISTSSFRCQSVRQVP
jgi:hypothetical protein